MQNTSLMKGIALCAVLAFGLSGHTQDAAKQQKNADQKVDISDLENKYWAPKDTDFSVVQNRTYAKAGHFFLTPQYGFLVNDSYSSGSIYGLTANYFFTERHGVQLSYQHFDVSDQDSINSFRGISSGATPNFNRAKDFIGVGYSFVPFYAKMSFIGKRIMYFDMAITPVIGMTKYEQMVSTGNKDMSNLSYGVDITQYYFINRWFAIRLDLDNHWTNETKVSWSTNGQGLTPGQKLNSYSNLDTTFMVGATFYY